MNRILKGTGNDAVGYGLAMIVWFLPLVICNQMMWDFYVPKELFFQLAIAAVLVVQLFRDKTTLRLNLLDIIAITGLLLPGIISIVLSQSYINSLRLPCYSVLFYLLIKSINFIDREEYFCYLLWVTCGLFSVGSIMAIYGILQYLNLDFLHPKGVVTFGPKVIGTLGHANVLGGYLAMIVPLGITVNRFTRTIGQKILNGLGLAVIIGALILTQSRGAWIALTISLLVFNYHHIKKGLQKIIRQRIVLLSLLTILIVGGLGLFYWLLTLNLTSVIGRLFVWRITWLMFLAHPLFGIGYQRYPVEYLNYQAQFFEKPGVAMFFDHAANMKQADNEYLQILAENGLVGVTLALLFIVILYRYFIRLQKTCDHRSEEYALFMAFGALTTILLLHSIVDNPLRNLAIRVIFLFVVGMISVGIGVNTAPLSFRNRLSIKILTLMLLCYTVFKITIEGSAYITWRQGQALFKAGYLAEGIEKYIQAAKKLPPPGRGELLFHLGSAYAYTNQPKQALPLLQQSKETFNDKNIYLAEGLSYYRLEKFDQAEQILLMALRMYPNLLLPRLWLAEIYLKTGRKTEALRRLSEIQQIQPKTINAEVLTIKADAERLMQIIKSS